MKRIVYLVFLLILLIYGCSDKNSVMEPEADGDPSIVKEVVGDGYDLLYGEYALNPEGLFFIKSGYNGQEYYSDLYYIGGSEPRFVRNNVTQLCGITPEFLYFMEEKDGVNKLAQYDYKSDRSQELIDEVASALYAHSKIYYGKNTEPFELRCFDIETSSDTLIFTDDGVITPHTDEAVERDYSCDSRIFAYAGHVYGEISYPYPSEFPYLRYLKIDQEKDRVALDSEKHEWVDKNLWQNKEDTEQFKKYYSSFVSRKITYDKGISLLIECDEEADWRHKYLLYTVTAESKQFVDYAQPDRALYYNGLIYFSNMENGNLRIWDGKESREYPDIDATLLEIYNDQVIVYSDQSSSDPETSSFKVLSVAGNGTIKKTLFSKKYNFLFDGGSGDLYHCNRFRNFLFMRYSNYHGPDEDHVTSIVDELYILNLDDGVTYKI